jgi:hypothetical protein
LHDEPDIFVGRDFSQDIDDTRLGRL